MKEIYYEITKTMNNLPLSIYLHKQSPCQICTAHWHRALELSIVFEENVIFFNNGKKRIRYKNSVNLTNCEEIHYSIPQFKRYSDKIVGYTIQINYNFLEKMIPNIKNIYFDIDDPNKNKKITNYMVKIYQEFIDDKLSKNMSILMMTLKMLIFLYEECSEVRYVGNTLKTKNILKYINEHYKEELHVYEVAKYFGYSREYFSRLLKKEIGMSFKEYLTQYRLNKSLNELLNINKNIAEVALNNGFSNETQYISTFKKIYNITPGQYRKSHNNDK